MNYLDDCAGYQNRPGTNDAADEGTYLHGIMEQLVKQVIAKKAELTQPQLAQVATAGELTDEQLAYLGSACRRTDQYIKMKPVKILVELKIRVVKSNGQTLNTGYLDVVFFYANGLAVVIDYKFGVIPVKPAIKNWQGKNYAAGILQMYPAVTMVGIEFVQPKLNFFTTALLKREDLSITVLALQEIIDRAEFVFNQPEKGQQFMQAGKYCSYCARNGTCAVLANYRGVVAAKYQMLPVPTSFKGAELIRPEDIALARYWCDIVETAAEEVKKRAFEIADANGGSISCTLPDGQVITYSIRERQSDRSLGSAIEVAEALKEVVTAEEVLGAADLSIGKLEKVVKEACVALAKAKGEKLTKKKAWEQVESTLTANGLLTRSSFVIRYLKQENHADKSGQIAAPPDQTPELKQISSAEVAD